MVKKYAIFSGKHMKMAKNVQISISPLVTFFGTYIMVILAKFQRYRSIFVEEIHLT